MRWFGGVFAGIIQLVFLFPLWRKQLLLGRNLITVMKA